VAQTTYTGVFIYVSLAYCGLIYQVLFIPVSLQSHKVVLP